MWTLGEQEEEEAEEAEDILSTTITPFILFGSRVLESGVGLK